MPDETTVTTGNSGTTVTTGGTSVTTESNEPKALGITEYVLYKLDRTIAVVGLIIIAMWVCWLKLPDGMQIVNTAVGGLIGYICGRNAK